MYSLIIAGIVATIIIGFLYIRNGLKSRGVYNWKWDSSEWGMYAFVSILLIAACTFGAGLLLSIPGSIINAQTQSNTELTALNLGSGTSANMFLGSGYIDKKLQYSYITKDARGAMKANTIPSDQVSIIEQADHRSELVCMNPDWTWLPNFNGSDCTAYIPPGSVVSNYNVSLGK